MGMSGAERQRRFIDRLKQRAAVSDGAPVSDGADATVQAALAALEGRVRGLEALWTKEREARLAAEALAQPAQRRAEKAEKEIVVLVLKINELEKRLKRRERRESAPKNGKPPSEVLAAVIKALHPDHAAHSTIKSREEALKLFLPYAKAAR
jgi:hypothetical protein